MIRESTTESLIRAGAFAVGGALLFAACEKDPFAGQPVVVTDEMNVVVDMPVGVRWDVVGLDPVTCDLHGGTFNTVSSTCEGIDY